MESKKDTETKIQDQPAKEEMNIEVIKLKYNHLFS